ncbi:MAG: hypothetical protein ACXAE3_17790, partial [Candidatus Kariarchaeaceae archaeon]|jgi:hypothetical protein
MKEGLAFSFSSRMMVLLVSSSVLIMAAYKVWISLILFVIYFQYAGTDASAGILRWLVWFSFATLAAYAGKLSKKLTVKPWIPRLSLAFSFFYYIVPAVLLFFIPLPNPAEFTLAGSIMIYLLMVIGMFFVATRANLEKKLQLEIIPDDLRNSYYSLIPSLSLLISAFFITIIGSIVTNSGIISGLLAVGAISFVAVFLEFLAIQLYEPSEDIEEEDENPLYNIYSIEVYDSLEYRIPTKWKFAKDVELIWDQLLEIAYQDDKVSKDEMDLLDHIMIHLKDYGEILERAREDDIITEEEKLELVLARAKLLQKVEEKAKDDSVITEEEEKILDKLKFIIHQLQEEQES